MADETEERRWMYEDWSSNGPNANWCKKTQEFIIHAFSRPNARREGVHCPCKKCGNFKKQTEYDISHHLVKNGFVPNYYIWTDHGENAPRPNENYDDTDNLTDMLHDINDANQHDEVTTEAEGFFKILEASEQPVHNYTKETILSAVTRLMAFKSQFSVSAAGYDILLRLICDLLPEDSSIPKNFNESKKFIGSLGMPYEKIDACYNGCMLFRKEQKDKIACDKCKEPRYHDRNSGDSNKHLKPIPRKVLRYFPIIPRLKRLFMSEEIAKHMGSHKQGFGKSGVMVHPSDGEAWKSFDGLFPQFAKEPRNVRLGLCTDGFTPFSFGAASYSCWPVFLVPYNLPPAMCMKKENIFLTLIVPGPQHPGKNLDVYMEPLYDDLKLLWDEGVIVYDRSVRNTFTLKACYFYSVHDLPALGMVYGHSTHGKFACPVCLRTVSAFWLVNGQKYCWFDCHRQFLPMNHSFRKSLKAFRKRQQVLNPPPSLLTGEQIHEELKSLVPNKGKGTHKFEGYGQTHNWTHISGLWDLEYFDKLVIRHNIDVMHTEKNVTEALLATVLDITDKTKDNVKARLDLELICDRSDYHMRKKTNGSWEKRRALFCLKREHKILVLRWLKSLKFPDMYAANIRRGVNLSDLRITGMKSHDYHIFMERLLPIALRGFIDNTIWLALAELSFFFRQLCSTEISIDRMKELEDSIPVLLCKLEKIFPPGFFNSMQHLLLHLPYEARMGGPVQYRWMYVFERLMKDLKKSVKNKARVEGCIAEAYIAEEISNFVSLYFASSTPSVRNKKPRYDDGYECHDYGCSLSTFQVPGRVHGRRGSKIISSQEKDAIMLYIYTNTLEMDDYVKKFDDAQHRGSRRPTQQQLDKIRKNGAGRGHPNLFEWFRSLCINQGDINKDLAQISHGCRNRVSCLTGYDVNNFRFRSEKYEKTMSNPSTTNTGVFLSCIDDDGATTDYYGVIEDIIELIFEGLQQFRLVLFQCRWFHPRTGVRKSPNIGLVEINHNTRLPGFEPFVLPHQCKQVYYTPYPCQTGDLRNWWVVHPSPQRGNLRVLEVGDVEGSPSSMFYQEDTSSGTFTVEEGNDLEHNIGVGEAEVIHDSSDIELLNKLSNMNIQEQGNEPPPSEISNDIDATRDDSDLEDFYDDPDDF